MPTRLEHYALTGLAVAFALGALIEELVRPTVKVGGQRYDRAPEVVLVLALTAAVALVALRGRLGVLGPLAAIGTVGVATLPAPAFALNSSFVFLFVMLTCGISGYLSVGRRSGLGLVFIVLIAALAEWRNPQRSLSNGVLVAGFMGIAWCTGLLARRPVSQARSAEERARRVEEEQAEAARRAVTEERQRIARELHDIIAHSVSVMTLQAGAVRRRRAPEQARETESLLAVERTGREALAEMRRLVGLLHEETAPSYAPQPGLGALDSLI